MKSAAENRKLSLNECKQTLNGSGDEYTDEQVIKIRDWLYHIADIAIEAYEMEHEQNFAETIEVKNKDKP